MKELTIVDSNMGVGRSGLGYNSAERPEQLLSVMDYYGIEKALIYDIEVFETGEFAEFERIIDFCSCSQRFLPTVILGPPACGEYPLPGVLVPRLLAAGVCGVRFFPQWHNYDFLPYCLDPLLALLEEHRMPVFYSAYEHGAHPWLFSPRWEHIATTAAAYPQLPIVINYTGMLQNRYIFPLLAGYPNIAVDLSCQSLNFLEYVAAEFGPEHLVFGSHCPVEDPAMHLMSVRYAALDPQVRHQIAGGNLLTLIKGVG